MVVEDLVFGYSSFDLKDSKNKEPIDLNISKYLKHKPPILLIDKILELDPGVKTKTSLELNEDKWFFNCHYPEYPVMPGTLLLEAMSQTMTLAITSINQHNDELEGLPLLSKINNVKFKKEALPGLKLIMNAQINSSKRGIVKGDVKCESDGNLICSCDMTIVIPNAVKKLSNHIRRKK